MSTIIPRYAFWNPGTWQIPKLYWDAFSDEQRIHAICKQLGKVIAYADFLGINTEDIAQRLEAIEQGELDEYIEQKIEEWFKEHEPELFNDVQALNAALPISEFSVDHTVTDALDELEETVNTSISGVNNDISAINTRLERIRTTLGHFVVIGDSFSKIGHNVTATTVWWYKFSQFISMTPHCYAENGCGYIRGSKPFSSQLNEAIADTTYNHNDVGYVFVFGSLNDCYSSFTDDTYKNAVANLITDAKTAFPNAEIVVAGINTAEWQYTRTSWTTPGGNTIYHTTKSLELLLGETAIQYNMVRFVPFSRLMCGMPAWYNDGHPTPTGNVVIANAFENAITGAPMSFKVARTLNVSPVHGSGNLGLTWNDSIFHWYASSAKGASTGSGTYELVYPIPYGMEGLLDVAPSYNGMISLAAKKTTPRNEIQWGYITANLPSYVSNPQIDASLYVQSYLVQATPDASACAIRGL